MSAESELADVIRKLGEKLDAMSGVSSSTRTASLDKKEMANLTDRIKKLAAAAKDDADASKALQKIMEDQRRAIMSQSKSRADKEQEWLDLQEKINKSSRRLDDDTKNQIQSKAKEAKAASDHAEATQKVTEKTKQWQEKFDTFGKSLAPAGAAIGSLVSAYQSGGSDIQTAGKLMSAEVQLASSGLQQVGAGATGLGTSMMATGGKTAKFGAITAVAGTALSMFASGANALAQKVIPVLTTELDKALNGFRSLSTSGALFADGVVGMKEAGKAAGLDLTEFSNVVKHNSSDLAASGLGVTEGSKRIGNVFKSGGKVFQDGLFKLGYTAEEQAGLVAETMGQMRRLGAQPTDKEVAAQTQKYAENLRVIANVTGEDAKTKLKQINEQNQIAAFQAELSKKGPEQQAEINAAMSTMTALEQKNFRERVMFQGRVVNTEGAAYEAQIGGAREKAEKMYDLFQKNALTYDAASDVTTEFVNQIAENGKNAQGLNQAAYMGVQAAQGAASSYLETIKLQQQYGDRAKVQETKDKAAQAAKDAAEAEQRRKEGKPPKENDITGQMLDAAQSARAFKIAMQDEFLKENTLGKFAAALNDANAAALKLVKDWGGTVTGANATFMDALSNLGGTALEVISGLGSVAQIFSLFKKGPHLGGPHGGGGGGPHPPGGGGGGRMSRMWESSTKFLKDGFGKITGVFTGGAAKMAAVFSGIVGAITTKGGAMAEGIAKAAGAAVEGIKSFRRLLMLSF